MTTPRGGVIQGSNAADVAIAFARRQLGKPYLWGGTGPDRWDCSGLVQGAYAAAGISLPRTTYEQVNSGQAVSQSELQPGDLVFPDPGHVQIFLGNGFVLEAPHTGAQVRIIKMWGFWRGRRVTAPGSVAAGSGAINGGFAPAGPWGPDPPFSTDPRQALGDYFKGLFTVNQPHMRALLGGALILGGALVGGLGVIILAAYGLQASGARRALDDSARPIRGAYQLTRRAGRAGPAAPEDEPWMRLPETEQP